jgi:hypothetical protein
MLKAEFVARISPPSRSDVTAPPELMAIKLPPSKLAVWGDREVIAASTPRFSSQSSGVDLWKHVGDPSQAKGWRPLGQIEMQEAIFASH